MTEGQKRTWTFAGLAGLLWWFWPWPAGAVGVTDNISVRLTTADGETVRDITDADLQENVTLGVLTIDQAQAIANALRHQPADPDVLESALRQLADFGWEVS